MTAFKVVQRLPGTIVRAVFGAVFFVAVGLSWLIPPMQSPDEESHIKRAYLISQGDFLLNCLPPDTDGESADRETAAFEARAREHGGRIGGTIDVELGNFIAVHLTLAREAGKRLTRKEMDLIDQQNWQETRHFQILPGTGYYFPAIYIPQAIGLGIGQKLDLTIQNSYNLAKVVTLLVCFLLIGVAFRLVLPSPLVIAILLLPMTFFQMLLPTIDGLTTSLTVLTASLFLVCSDKNRPYKLLASFGLAFCIFLLVTTRTNLLPLVALPFYLAWRRHCPRDYFLAILVVVASSGWVLFAMQTTNDPRIVRDQSTIQLVMQYAHNPGAFFSVVWASLTDFNLLVFYLRSFIGVLGWLDTYLVEYFYPLLSIGLGLCALASVSISSIHKNLSGRLLLFGTATASVLLVFFAMLVTWTPHPATSINGVQGRYFIAPAILLAYAASGSFAQQSPLRQKSAVLVLAMFVFASQAALMMAVWGRYH